ncbi:MAG: hypothetical protein HXY34_09410 [Candidatus Thorarchaeota archaeon]|nr:hypothetical protein [Candidatus Thorarchaeota archaeon]
MGLHRALSVIGGPEDLARILSEKDTPEMGQLIRESTDGGAIDVTNWHPDVIKILLSLCRQEGLQVTLKHGMRYFVFTKLPRGLLLGAVVDAMTDPVL